jgi:L-threonine kinase
MKVQALMPGSCGELVQGTINGVDFHITCPINRYSKVLTSLISPIKDVWVSVPEGLDKTAAAIRVALHQIGADNAVEAMVKSELVQGKGMASSTADIAAALVSTFKLFGRDITEREVADIALSIEPTDGTIFSGIVAFDHLKGKLLKRLGDAPPIDIVVLEPPGVLNTIVFNSKKKSGFCSSAAEGKTGRENASAGTSAGAYASAGACASAGISANTSTSAAIAASEGPIKEAFDMAVQGLKDSNLRLIGEAATISSILNQQILLKPELDAVIDICKRRGGLGVNVAHSGTVMGILVERGFGRRLLEKIEHYVPGDWKAYVVSVVGGGARLEDAGSLIDRVPAGAK